MAMEKAKGKTLQYGVTATGLTGIHEQSATKTKLGELKEYKDKDGNVISVYKVGYERTEITVEALVETSAPDYEVGEATTIGDLTGIITAYSVTESNEDVKKVSMTLRTYPDVEG